MSRLAQATLSALVVGLLFGPNFARAADAPAPPPAIESLRACLDSAGASADLVALIVVDESGSIKKTDPNHQRIPGVRALLSALGSLAQNSGGADVRVRTRIATFADGYRGLLPNQSNGDPTWEALDETTFDRLSADVEMLRERNAGAFTDYQVALESARRDLAIESANLTARGGVLPCKLLVFFTDGAFDLGGGAAAEARGRDVLCRAGGVTDGLRNDGVITISVGLASGLASQPLRFLEALTDGDAIGEKCGTTGSEATGLFLAAGSADDLFFVLGGGIDRPTYVTQCAAGTPCEFDVPEGFDGFALRLQTPQPGGLFTLRSPSGRTFAASSRQPVNRTFEQSKFRLRWFGDRQAELALATEKPDAIDGRWQVIFDGKAGTGRIDVRLRASLVPSVLGNPRLRAGQRTAVSMDFTRRDGRRVAVDSPLRRTASIRAMLEVGDEPPTPLTLTPTPAGRYTTSIELPSTVKATTARLVLSGELAQESGADVSISRRTRTLRVLPPAEFPLVPDSVHLPAVRGTDATSAQLRITGSGLDAGCVWFDPGAQVSLPDDDGITSRGSVALAPSATSPGRCIRVAKGATKTVEVEVRPSQTGTGTAKGVLHAHLRSDGSVSEREVPIVLEFQMRPAPNDKVRWLIFSLLMLLGIAIPVAVLVFVALRAARLGPPQMLRVGSTEVEWSSKAGLRSLESVTPSDMELSALATSSARAVPVAEQFLGDGLRAVRRLGGSWPRRISALFVGGEAVVGSDGGLPVVVGVPDRPIRYYESEKRSEIPLSLGPAWIFQPKRVREAGAMDDGVRVVEGSLTLIVPENEEARETAARLWTLAQTNLGDAPHAFDEPAERKRWRPFRFLQRRPDSLVDDKVETESFETHDDFFA